MKILTRILLLVVIAVDVIMGSVSLMISNNMQQAVELQIDRELSTNLNFIVREIGIVIKDVRNVGEVISRNQISKRAIT